MELKVTIDGLERSVSGVTENTTCSQIIYALAHATSQRGRFVMVEKYRNVERRLTPNDRPLETLRKWREHAANVTFKMLRVDLNDEVCNQVEELMEPITVATLRNPSSSSVNSSLPGRSATSGQLENGQRSTSSLPTYAASSGVTGTLGRSRRPPPPDYKSVMEQKSSIMARSIRQPDIRQQDIYDQPKMEIYRFAENANKEEVAEYIAYEEELRQLLKQQKNLRTILQPLISSNWPQQYQQEVKKSHKLRASLEATKEAIDKTKMDIIRIEETEKELLQKLAMFEQEASEDNEENEDVFETSIDMNCSSAGTLTPQKVTA